MKVTTKTLKADMVKAAIERNIFSDAKEADKYSQKALYKMIKEHDELAVTLSAESKEVKKPVANESKKEGAKADVPKKESNQKIVDIKKGSKKDKGNKKPKESSGFNAVISPEQAKELISQINNGNANDSGQKKADKADKGKSKRSDAVVNNDDEQTPEQKKIANDIVKTFVNLKAQLEALHLENEELKKKNLKMQSAVDNRMHYEDGLYNELIQTMNKIANTRKEENVWVWTTLFEFSKKFSHSTDAELPMVLDIKKLIIDDVARKREEAEIAEQLAIEKEKAMEADAMYEGIHISYINGEAVKPDGMKKKDYKVFEGWYEDSDSWVTYILDTIAKADEDIIIGRRKKAMRDLEKELDGWYDEWYNGLKEDAGITKKRDLDQVVDMVKEVITDLFEYRDRDKALSNLTAIIDDLDLM